MPTDERKPPAPPKEAEVVPAEAAEPVAFPSSLIAAGDPPAPAEPETLMQVARFLQQRIPGFTQLTVKERQSLTRAAYLDPEFLDRAIHATGFWENTKSVLGLSGEEFRETLNATVQWDDVIRDFRALLQGMEDANLARKHKLGQQLLVVYSLLGAHLRYDTGNASRFRPYYEEMKKAMARSRKKNRKKDKEEDE